MVRNRFYLAPREAEAHAELSSLTGRLSALPLPNRLADGFVLHHSLELEQDPRAALREVARVIAPGGRILICAFNALSLWGIRAAYGRLVDDPFSNVRFVNPLRLLDWLALLGFKTEARVAYLGFGLPVHVNWTGSAQIRAWLDRAQPRFGGVLVVSALKQAHGVRWVGHANSRARPHIVGAAYPKPTVRVQSHILLESRACRTRLARDSMPRAEPQHLRAPEREAAL